MPSRTLTDSEINELLTVPKPLPSGWRRRLRPRARANEAHRRSELRIEAMGQVFVIKCRQSTENPLDFSIILVWRDENGNEYRLLRCNGPHPSCHTNRWEKRKGIEGHTFGPCFHIHRATQRYQESDFEIDGFAEPTEVYSDYERAISHLVTLAGFVDPDPPRAPDPMLFGGET